MSNRLGGKQGTAYLGTNANQPPNITFNNNDPTQYDSQNVSLGDFWLNTNTEGLWVLVSLAGNSTSKGVLATWVLISTGGVGDVQTLTGDNNTVHVPPTAGNINIIGTANNVTVTGNAVTSTLTINTGAHVATTYTEDSGSAAPAAGNLNVLGGTAGRDINTSGAGSTIHIDLNNAITLGDLSAIAGGSNALSCTTGDINIAAGNLKLPNTASTGNSGQIQLNATRFVHNYGVNNTFIGSSAGNLTLTVGSAQGCTGIGTSALNAQTTGSSNTALGYNCLILCDAGSNNTGFGALTLNNLTSGNQNCGIGQGSLSLLTTTSQNTGCGNNTLSGIVTGANNIALGFSAGSNNTTNDSNNIFIGNPGTAGDNNIIRFGVSGGGAGQQNKCFIAGIRGITTGVADAIAVLIDSSSQLGTVSSSKRYKENVQDMGDESSVVMDLRPVIFYYKQHPQVPAWGLIAEEVAELFPQLVVYDKEGEPETVKYHELPVLLLNELQKLSKRVEELERELNDASNK